MNYGVDLADFEGNVSYARYSNFRLGNACTNYTLALGSYSGDDNVNVGKFPIRYCGVIESIKIYIVFCPVYIESTVK